MTNEHNYSRTTLWALLEKSRVEIPIIQRDYAQGRPEQKEIRDGFLESLYQAFFDTPIELDFIYGSTERSVVQPLDGQQRLTTIFLLTWYLAQKEKKLTADGRLVLSSFTYETRVSSRDFCRDMVEAEIDIACVGDDLSAVMKDQRWFQAAWIQDPTIQAMLVMLDAIHLKFREAPALFDRLLQTDTSPISFLFLPLEKIGQTDDLYIKMNARGKPLSNFENFKAKLGQFIKLHHFNKKMFKITVSGRMRIVDAREYFSHNIDTKWADLFWSLSKGSPRTYDQVLQNFVNTLLINRYASKKSDDFLKILLSNSTPGPAFRDYVNNNCIDDKFMGDLFTLLDLLSDAYGQIQRDLGDDHNSEGWQLFENLIHGAYNDAAYPERVCFYAYYQYLIQWQTDGVFENEDSLKTWMRIVHNLVFATAPYNNEREFSASIRAIDFLIPMSNNILGEIINVDKLPGMDEMQFKEEQIKSALLQRDTSWGSGLFEIEQHGYFDGQIGFLLHLSGVQDYFDTHHHCQWTDEEDLLFKDRFSNYVAVAKSLFNEDGLRMVDNFRFHRALLTVGDYRISEGYNQSFVCNKKDRDISWKRFLKGDKSNVHRELLQKIFDQMDGVDPQTELQAIIERAPKTGDWRQRFIDNPVLFQFLKPSKMYVRENSPQGFVLLTGERMSGAHAELHTYLLHMNRTRDSATYPPFGHTHYQTSNSDAPQNPPCIQFDPFEAGNAFFGLNVSFDPAEGVFLLSFFETGNNQVPAPMKTALSDLGYEQSAEVFRKFSEEETVMDEIQSLCLSLNALNAGV